MKDRNDKIKGYYVNLEGCSVPVTEIDGKFYSHLGEVIIDGETVMEGSYEEKHQGFRVDEEYSFFAVQ